MIQLLYIAAPYTAKSHIRTMQNISEAKIMAQYYWIKGFAVICPHLNTAFMSGLIPENKFYQATLKMLTVCPIVVFHPDYHKSLGASAEYQLAYERAHKIVQLSQTEFDEIKTFVHNHIKEIK